LLRRDPGEDGVHQAVREVLDSLGAVVAKHPDYIDDAVIQRILQAGSADHF
jgi:glutamate dehydrogenase (NADP+)